ncbi:MAG: LCP family protein [Clostridiaceae bacterium]|nr:LCP family protein [Clostridiaceae bacterium]
MSSNRTILIWIGILTLIGIILIMVACETGVLMPNEQQDNVPQEADTNDGPEVTPKENTPDPASNQTGVQETVDEGPKTLTVGKPYSQKLVEEGSTNILILGEDKASSNFDTIGIVSIDSKSKMVKLIMIPRDTYIEYNDDIKAALDKVNLFHEAGALKINFTHHVGNRIKYEGRFDSGSISFLADVVEEKFNVEIKDYVKINTKGFVELIDCLGGVNINVPYDMHYEDPTQDLYIHIPAGKQQLDGYNAEGFVRFRQGYREDGTLFEIGDPGRKQNQLNFLRQLIKQKGTLKNVGKIPEIIKVLGRNVKHSVGLGDVLQTYMGMATDVIKDDYEIVSVNLNSEKMIRIDGSSYLVLE